jgi:endonuclease/exonuclease/phosphatase family metal-dependent hydrolase
MKLTGHKTDGVFRRYDIVSPDDLRVSRKYTRQWESGGQPARATSSPKDKGFDPVPLGDPLPAGLRRQCAISNNAEVSRSIGSTRHMRIVTWNMQRGFHGRQQCVTEQQRLLDGCDADIVVLTEVPASMSKSKGGIVCSDPRREAGKAGLEAWVSIASMDCRAVGPEVPFERMAVAAEAVVDNEEFLVYGSVLPWSSAIHQASYLSLLGESPGGLFARLLREQVSDVVSLRESRPDHTLIWAGDFNQTLSGPNYGGSKKGRHLLAEALDELDLVAWNQELPHAKPPMHAIDLICGPRGRQPRRVHRFEPVLNDSVLSDHAGYVVEL